MGIQFDILIYPMLYKELSNIILFVLKKKTSSWDQFVSKGRTCKAFNTKWRIQRGIA